MWAQMRVHSVMEQIGVRELKEQINEVIRRVRQEGDWFEVTYRGKAVALLVPVRESGESLPPAAFLERLDRLAGAIGPAWQGDASALEAIREQRREL